MIDDSTLELWLASAQQLTPSLLERYQSWLTHDECQRAERFRFARHRQIYLLTRAIEKTVLSQHTGIAKTALPVRRNEQGKPYLYGLRNALHYNLSNSSDWVVMAISRAGDVGVDVESTQRNVEMEHIAASFFHPFEHQALKMLDAQKKEFRQRFFSLWTLKEAYVKAIGLGLSKSLRSIRFEFLSQQSICTYGDDQQRWHYALMQLEQEHLLALCMPSSINQIIVRPFMPSLFSTPTEPASILACSHLVSMEFDHGF